MRNFSKEFALSVALLAAVGLLGLPAACSDNAGGGGGGSGNGGGSDAGGSGSATDAGGTATAGDATGGTGTAGDATSGDTGNGACEKRSNYLQVFHPNVYIILDRSGSMEGKKMKQAKAGLDTVADKVADKVRIGMAGYPIKSCCCSARQLLALGDHTPKEIKDAYRNHKTLGDLDAAGGTPTGMALYTTRQANRLETDDPTDNDDKRSKAIILITDGEPNDKKICGENAKNPFNEAQKLANEGIATYVVGYNSQADPNTLNRLAKAGGTNAPGSKRFYTASDGQELSKALLNITSSSVACSSTLAPKPPKGSSINVQLGTEKVPDSGYEYDESTGKVTLKGMWCDKMRQQASKGTSLNIDVGCPGCKVAGESCQSDSECCDGICKNGVCKEACRTKGQECISDGECCSQRCGGSGAIGQCVSG